MNRSHDVIARRTHMYLSSEALWYIPIWPERYDHVQWRHLVNVYTLAMHFMVPMLCYAYHKF